MADDAEKMRARRERAAAWAAQRKADFASHPSDSTDTNMTANNNSKADLNSTGMNQWVKSETGAESASTASGNDKGHQHAAQGWLNWSHQVVGSAEKASNARQSESGIRAEMVSWKNREGGIQTLANSYGTHNSAGMQQEEVERILEDMDEDYRLPRTYEPQGYIDVSRCEIATMVLHYPFKAMM